MSERHEPTNDSFLSQRWGLPFLPEWLSLNTAMIVLMVVFFLVPFALRGARMSLERMKNDVKDWLPKSFPETADLDWFRDHFLGEQFILATWPGMTGLKEDEKFRLFLEKLFLEVPPSNQARFPEANAKTFYSEELGMYIRSMGPEWSDYRRHYRRKAGEPLPTGPVTEAERKESSEFIGDQLGLYVPNVAKDEDAFYTNWGGEGEKWIKGRENLWYYIKAAPGDPADALPGQPARPVYKLYQWDGGNTMLGGAYRSALQTIAGVSPVSGEEKWTFRPEDGEWFFSDPRRLEAQWFKTITTGPSILARLTRQGDGESGGQLGLQEPEARARLAGSLFGKDLRPVDAEGKPIGNVPVQQTCIVLTLTEAARRELAQTIGRGMLGKPRGQLYQVADECHIPEDDLKFGGPPVDNVAIDEEGQITLVQLIWYSAAVGIFLSYFLLRSVYQTMMVFFVGGVCAVLALAMVYWTNQSVDAVLLTMPALVYVLGISGTIHIINHYRQAAIEGGVPGAPERALAHAWLPAVLCNVTTALGLVSLCVSDIIPIWKFGLFSAIGCLLGTILIFTYLPAALEIWPSAKTREEDEAEHDEAVKHPTWWQRIELGWEHLMESIPGRVCDFLLANYGTVSIVCFLLTILAASGVMLLKTEIQLLKMFDENTKLIRDYAWLEENLGKLVPMEIVVRIEPKLIRNVLPGPDGEPPAETPDTRFALTMLERMRAAERVRSIIADELGEGGRGIVGPAMAATSFAPDLLPPGKDRRGTFAGKYSLTNRRLEAHRQDFVDSDFLRTDKLDGSDLWRVSIRIAALNSVDPDRFKTALESVVEPIVAAYPQRLAILKDIDARRGGLKSFTDRTVMLLGAKPPPAAAKKDPAARSAPSEDQNERVRTLTPAEQTELFVSQLRATLLDAGVKVSYHYPAEGEKLDAAWAQKLAAYDCVAYVEKLPQYAAIPIAAHAKPIELAGYLFDPADDSTTARKEQSGVYAVYTGVVPVVNKTQRELLKSLNESFVQSLATITPTMMLILIPWGTLFLPLFGQQSLGVRLWKFFARGGRGLFFAICGGFIAMWPNVFPVAIVFGVMGFLGIKIDIGTMMTASVAIGIAVDDTLHFLTFYRDGLNSGKTKEEAIHDAYQKCAVSFIQTALIAGCGLGVFWFSSFTPTQRFGGMMFVLLLTAVFGDLLFLPSLLAGPLGWFFQPDEKDEEPGAPGSDSPGHSKPASDIADNEPAPASAALALEGGLTRNALDEEVEEPPNPPDDGEPGGATRHSKLRSGDPSRLFRSDRPHER